MNAWALLVITAIGMPLALRSSKPSITPGKHADLVVLAEDLFAIEPEAIPEVGVWMTVVGGKVVVE